MNVKLNVGVISSVLVLTAMAWSSAGLQPRGDVHPLIREYLNKKAEKLSQSPRLRELLDRSNMNGPDCTAEEAALALAQEDFDDAELALAYHQLALDECENSRNCRGCEPVEMAVDGTRSVLKR